MKKYIATLTLMVVMLPIVTHAGWFSDLFKKKQTNIEQVNEQVNTVNQGDTTIGDTTISGDVVNIPDEQKSYILNFKDLDNYFSPQIVKQNDLTQKEIQVLQQMVDSGNKNTTRAIDTFNSGLKITEEPPLKLDPETERIVESLKQDLVTPLNSVADKLQTVANTLSTNNTALVNAITTSMSIPLSPDATTKSITQTAHGFVVGDWVYLSAASTYAKADADLAASFDTVGVVTAVVDANTFSLSSEGYVTGLSGLTAATRYYLSTTAGAITATAPTSNIKAVFLSDTTTSGWVQQYEVGASSQALTYGRVNAAANLASKSFVSTGVGSTVDFTATVYSSGMTFSGTNGITPSVAGRYRAAYYLNAGSDETANNATIVVVQGGVSLGSIYVNQHNSAGSVNQTAGFIDVEVTAGTPVFLHYQPDITEAVAFDKGIYFQMTQLPTASSTVVDGTVAVNDQAASGYFDVGTMRMQWGTHNDGNVDTTTVTLPVAFANTAYSVVATSNTSAGSLSTESKTTTTFDIDRASTTTGAQNYSWFAVGLKP
jgi:tetrahydromethanopterin S-methyltransferase subunit B